MADYRFNHLSVRVPWHDSGWSGHVCMDPLANHQCSALPYIATERREAEEAEDGMPGVEFSSLDTRRIPPCLKERSAFLSPNQHTIDVRMPYSTWSGDHKHILPTTIDLPPWGGAIIPFRWMHKDHAWKLGAARGLDVGPQHEPQDPDWLKRTSWVQGIENQRALLDAFAGGLQEATSLVFFYAKRTPLSDADGRFLVGVGKLGRMGQLKEYPYEGGRPGGRLQTLVWERTFQHSIRRDASGKFSGGVILPYWRLLQQELGEENLSDFTAALPQDEELKTQFSFGSEHVTHQGAAAALWSLKQAAERLSGHVDYNAADALAWIDAELNRIWQVRGPYPGLGSALSAFDKSLNGTLFTYALSASLGDNDDPWEVANAILSGNRAFSTGLKVPKSISRKWVALSQQRPFRIDALRTIARFDITADQALRCYVDEEISKEVVRNPYALYEKDRFSESPVSFWTVDSGLYGGPVRPPLPATCELDLEDAKDPFRTRAGIVEALERAAAAGDTILTAEPLVEAIAAVEAPVPIPVDTDDLSLFGSDFAPEVVASDNTFQLQRFVQYGELIRSAVNTRLANRPRETAINWPDVIASILKDPARDADEEEARREKAEALAVLAGANISVLAGPAGTGKTLVIGAFLDAIPEGNGAVLLAPTGKARVRMQSSTGRDAKTVAQFLLQFGRYDDASQRYFPTRGDTAPGVKLVIVDEASMLTEDQFAALFDVLPPNCRVVFVGDPQQLPPIGAGRPFVDLINWLCSIPGRAGYAELRIRRRQAAADGNRRDLELEDVQFSELFSGRSLPAGEDEILARIRSGEVMERLKFHRFRSDAELQALLKSIVCTELGLTSDREKSFSIALGAALSEKGNPYFKAGLTADAAERWQVLTPHRVLRGGAQNLNRILHLEYRSGTMAFAQACNRGRPFKQYRIPAPLGPEQIVYGDKVICLRNGTRRITGPDKRIGYVANGEIGVVVGESSVSTSKLKNLDVELSTQPGISYKFWKSEFDEDGSKLELAYAITVHKAQGSQFGTVILILPKRSAVLSREMLYTALTRQQRRIVILHEGEMPDILAFRADRHSEIKRRSTNLFSAPNAVCIEKPGDKLEGYKRRTFLEENLIHRSASGAMLSSKNEVIIADALHDAGKELGIKFIVEPEIDLAGETRWADFIVQDQAGESWYWEHLGMLREESYRRRWERKLSLYRQAGIVPYCEDPSGRLIITKSGDNDSIDSQAVRSLIRRVWGKN